MRIVLAVLIAAGLAFASTAASAHQQPVGPTLSVSSDLRDLQPAVDNPTDGVSSRAQVWVLHAATQVTLRLDGFDAADAGRTFGAHVHTGPCIAGDGAAAGPHYNADVAAGITPARISEATELWLDFAVRRDGSAQSRTSSPFLVVPGNRSIVVHELATAPNGTAGARLACLPLAW